MEAAWASVEAEDSAAAAARVDAALKCQNLPREGRGCPTGGAQSTVLAFSIRPRYHDLNAA